MKRILVFFVISSGLIFFNGCENDGDSQMDLNGRIISNTGCKHDLKSGTETLQLADNLSCAEYTYDDTDKKLIINHLNAGFNCCPESLYCTVSLQNNLIIIKELEVEPLCDCLCLYDLVIEIEEVAKKKYQIEIQEPYSGEQDKLIFSVDLSANTSGSFCATRDSYPWDITGTN